MVACRCLLLWLFVGMFLAGGAALRAAEPPELFIEAELDPPDPYLQAEVRYSVRLYRRSSLLQGYLVMPELPDVAVEEVERGEPVPVLREGRRYEMIHWRYLLFPQRSGRLSIPGMIYSGREVYLKGAALALEVRPPPAEQIGHWLPARALTLSESWRTPDPPWQVGDPLERTLVIEAQGLTGAQLPQLTLPESADLEMQYLGAQIDNRLVDGRMLGRRSERFRLIPRRAGRHELPALRLTWWDVGQDGARQAVLPARMLEVAAVPVTAAAEPPEPQGDEAVINEPLLLPGLFAALAGALLLLLLVGLLAAGYCSPHWQRVRERRCCLRRLRKACHQNESAAAAAALLHWAATIDWGANKPLSLGDVASRVEGVKAKEALWALDACLYAGVSRDWDGALFKQHIWPALHRGGREHVEAPISVLPPLNP